MKLLEDLINEEDSKLSHYAVFNKETLERIYLEEPHSYRLPLHRDRDRILHSWAFKRLEYKTQVFINSEGDNFRTRLTHSLEVAGISRTICYSLGLNPHLGEVIALAHDLGHTPFGHAGQDILHELMKPYGGFEHNKQSLRVVQKLESRYPEFSGLNLTRVTLVGIMKHGGDYEESELKILRNEIGPSMEAILTDAADEIAYIHHDIEDGLERNLININDIYKNELWKEIFLDVEQQNPNTSMTLKQRKTIRLMMNKVITDFIENSHQNIKKYHISNKQDFRNLWKQGKKILENSLEISQQLKELKSFLYENLYQHPKILEKSKYGQKIIEFLFNYLIKNPSKIPESYTAKHSDPFPRLVADYISGMTDRYAELKAKEFGFL